MYTSSALYMYSLINFKTKVNKPCLVYQGERTILIVVLWQHLEAKPRIKLTVTRHTEWPPSQNCAQNTHFLIFFLDCAVRGAGNLSTTTVLTQARTSAAGAALEVGRKERSAARAAPPPGSRKAPGEARRVPRNFQQRPAAPRGSRAPPRPACPDPPRCKTEGKAGREKRGMGEKGGDLPRWYLPSRCGAGRGRGQAGGSAQRGGERRGWAAQPTPAFGSRRSGAPRPRLRRSW